MSAFETEEIHHGKERRQKEKKIMIFIRYYKKNQYFSHILGNL